MEQGITEVILKELFINNRRKWKRVLWMADGWSVNNCNNLLIWVVTTDSKDPNIFANIINFPRYLVIVDFDVFFLTFIMYKQCVQVNSNAMNLFDFEKHLLKSLFSEKYHVYEIRPAVTFWKRPDHRNYWITTNASFI